jgi:hypothetical protein
LNAHQELRPQRLTLLAGCRTAQRATGPLERPRLIAEWEPAIGAMVAWPIYVPDTLVQEIAQDDLLFVLAKPEHLEAARSRMAELGIAAEQVRFVPCSVESSWPLDWGPTSSTTAMERGPSSTTSSTGGRTTHASPLRTVRPLRRPSSSVRAPATTWWWASSLHCGLGRTA